nr:thioredoxin domain-containing protein [Haladaptatus halobius]
MGDGDAPVTATVYGAWKCPYTQNFVLEDMTSIIEQYVEPGNVALEFRAVAYEDGEGFHGPDEPRAARAGLAVWHFDPTSYWSYFGYLFQNQQSFDGWATIKRLLRFAKKAGVRHRDRIESEIESGSYQSQIEETMSRVQKIPIPAVPRVVVDGTVTVPTVAPERTRTQLERALEQASNSNGGTTTKGSGMTTTTSHSSSA